MRPRICAFRRSASPYFFGGEHFVFFGGKQFLPFVAKTRMRMHRENDFSRVIAGHCRSKYGVASLA
jgi:hypothetical protein